MKAITETEFIALAESERYYTGRWPYTKAALDYAARFEPKTVLEIGVHIRALYDGSTTMDAVGDPAVLHDATKAPWPFDRKQFDVVVALQVWEHLDGGQQMAFLELMRVAKAAVLSFPLNWTDCDPTHDGITEAMILDWCCGIKPVEYVDVGGGNRVRRVAWWRFD
jgi:hypothetical protein